LATSVSDFWNWKGESRSWRWDFRCLLSSWSRDLLGLGGICYGMPVQVLPYQGTSIFNLQSYTSWPHIFLLNKTFWLWSREHAVVFQYVLLVAVLTEMFPTNCFQQIMSSASKRNFIDIQKIFFPICITRSLREILMFRQNCLFSLSNSLYSPEN
jgi:hypothetical protein